MGLTVYNKMNSVLFVVLIALTYEGNCLRTLLCVSSNSQTPPFDILDEVIYNNYDEPYVPWWPVNNVPCNNHYRSPLLDHWTNLNVTKLKMSVITNHQQVLYTEEFNMTGLNITEMFMDLNVYNQSFHLTGENGMDFLVADPADSRNIKFGMLPEPDYTRFILDVTGGYFRLPYATGFQKCINYPSDVPDPNTITLNVTNQEQCAYSCYRRQDNTAVLYSVAGQPGHVCRCYTPTLGTTGYDVSDVNLCGNQCQGDASQKCGNRTHFVVINAHDAVNDGFLSVESLATMLTVVIPMSGEIQVNLSNTNHVNNDGKAFITKMEVTDEQWPNIQVRYSQDTCGTYASVFEGLKFSLTKHNGTIFIDDLMAACLILNNATELNTSLEVNITFSPSHVVFPSKFYIEAEFENDVCEYKDVGVVDTVIPDSNIDIWYPVSGSTHLSTINHGGILINAYRQPFPSPRVIAYRSTDSYPYVSHISITTTAPHITLEVVDCGGISENRSLTPVSQTGSFYKFNETVLVNGAPFTCVDYIAVEIETDSVTSYEAFIFKLYIMGCCLYGPSPVNTYSCGSVTDLTGAVPGFPYNNIVLHSSSTDISPTPVKPCGAGLYMTRDTFAEPLVITVILLTDNRKESLSVNYIRVVGDVDTIIIQYTERYSNQALISLPYGIITINGDEFEANIYPTDMYAVRIADHTKGIFHNITDVVINACILTVDILDGTYVNDSRHCETTTTSAMSTSTIATSTDSTPNPTTTTLTSTTRATTTLASTTTQECCACTPVRPTISVQQAEEKAEQLAKELQVDKSTLSSTIRKKTSAKDARPSAKMVGSIGIILLSLILGLVIVLDADYIYKIYKMVQKSRRLQQKLKQAEDKPASAEAVESGQIENDANKT